MAATTRRRGFGEDSIYFAGHAVAKLGAVKLRELTARHVQAALAELSGSLSTRSLRRAGAGGRHGR
jgi:hypothetical protein